MTQKLYYLVAVSDLTDHPYIMGKHTPLPKKYVVKAGVPWAEKYPGDVVMLVEAEQ